MYDLVAEDGDAKCAYCNDDDTSVSWNIMVHSVDQLSADDGVDGRPANAS